MCCKTLQLSVLFIRRYEYEYTNLSSNIRNHCCLHWNWTDRRISRQVSKRKYNLQTNHTQWGKCSSLWAFLLYPQTSRYSSNSPYNATNSDLFLRAVMHLTCFKVLICWTHWTISALSKGQSLWAKRLGEWGTTPPSIVIVRKLPRSK